jgi:thymidylate kinase
MYTTIIRLNYDKGISIDETVNQILSYALTPDMIFILSTSPQTIIKRRILRDNDANIDTDFYVYENSVFKKLNNHQKFAKINNDRDITETTEE